MNKYNSLWFELTLLYLGTGLIYSILVALIGSETYLAENSFFVRVVAWPLILLKVMCGLVFS